MQEETQPKPQTRTQHSSRPMNGDGRNASIRVKIDRAVVAKGLTDQTARGVLSGITAIARETAAYVIAEGIENVEMFDLVRQMGVQGVQGYLLGRPSETLPDTSALEGLGLLAQIS